VFAKQERTWGSTDWASTYKILTFKYCKGGYFLLKILHAEIVTRISIEMKKYFFVFSYCSLHARKMARSRCQDGRRKSRQDDPALSLLSELESHAGISSRQPSARTVDTYATGIYSTSYFCHCEI